MSNFVSFVNIANLPTDVQERLKVSLSDETKENISEQVLNGAIIIELLCSLLAEQKTTNEYMAEILGDKIH